MEGSDPQLTTGSAMARAHLTPLFRNIRGKVGDLIIRQYGNKTVVSAVPAPSKVPRTKKQKASSGRFARATEYATRVSKEPDVWALYLLRSRRPRESNTAYGLATSDFLHAPTIVGVTASGYRGRAGDAIVVEAYDDFEVTGVDVAVYIGDIEVEVGEAAYDGGRWIYHATGDLTETDGREGRIVATARDRPGNETVQEILLPPSRASRVG